MTTENYIKELQMTLEKLDHKILDQIILTLKSYIGNGTVFLAGNGGNSANALHMATDLSKGIYLTRGQSINVVPLHQNSALFSAAVNDLPESDYFGFLLEMSAKPGDLVILYTAGGTSSNIIKAADRAKSLGLKVIGLTGCKGKELDGIFDLQLHIESMNIQIVEDVHGIIGHLIYSVLSEN